MLGYKCGKVWLRWRWEITKILKSVFFSVASLQVSAFNAGYSDSGLFGVYTISQAADAGDVSI